MSITAFSDILMPTGKFSQTNGLVTWHPSGPRQLWSIPVSFLLLLVSTSLILESGWLF
jgi:hypothetical protein